MRWHLFFFRMLLLITIFINLVAFRLVEVNSLCSLLEIISLVSVLKVGVLEVSSVLLLLKIVLLLLLLVIDLLLMLLIRSHNKLRLILILSVHNFFVWIIMNRHLSHLRWHILLELKILLLLLD
jgi:hypothetical protein